MIPHITTGSDLGGLMRYLVGRGRENEHENPHVVGGDSFLQVWHGHEELDAQAAASIAAYLDEPHQVYGTEIRAKAWRQDPGTGARVPVLDADGRQVWRDVNVWHCSLSLAPGEVLSGEQWEQVTREFADGMGLTDVGGKAPVRWVAIHHGASKGGNDHVHIAASMVREDGTRWEGRWNDWRTAQSVCRDLEQRHHLTPVLGASHGTAVRGATPIELDRAQRVGAPMIQREELALRVRATAVASVSEAEWVRRLRSGGVVVKPRFAAGTTDVVVGYRAALRGQEEVRFYGGGQLGADLSLPRLRELWSAPSVEEAGAASAEWQAAFRGQAPAGKGREAGVLPAVAPEVARARLTSYVDRLTQVPASDRVAWSVAARDVSGALSAWARVDRVNAPALRQAASVVARAGQDRRAGAAPGQRRPDSSAAAAALVLMAGSDRDAVAMAALLAQLVRAAAALRDYHRETRNLREATALDRELARLHTVSVAGERPQQQRPDGRRLPPSPAKVRQAARLGRQAPVELPRPIETRPQTGARTSQERTDRDAGR